MYMWRGVFGNHKAWKWCYRQNVVVGGGLGGKEKGITETSGRQVD